MLLSIVIPAYNEEKRLPKTIHLIQQFLKEQNYDAEIIVVIEKSEDNTLELVQHLQQQYSNIRYLENDARYGKGYTVRKGVLNATGDYILFTDSDLSTPIQEINKMLPALGEYDCCFGQRVQLLKQPLFRRMMGVCFSYLKYIITGLKYRDTQCGFKVFTSYFGKSVFQQMQITGFAFDIEMLMLAQKMGFKLMPLQVEWYNDKDSRVSPIFDSIIMLRDLLRIKHQVKLNYSKKESQEGISVALR